MKVRFLKSPTGHPFYLSYSAGQKVNFPDEKAKELVEAGYAEFIEPAQPAPPDKGNTEKPEGAIAAQAETKKTTKKSAK